MSNEMSPLSTTGPGGEIWSFNPNNSRWTLEYKGKKSSSANPETLRRKLEAWHREGWGTSQDTQPEEVRIETRDVLLMFLDSSGVDLNARPVAVRASWDAGKGAVVVDKIKKDLDPKGATGWSTLGKDDGVLVDPFDPSERAYEALKERVRGHFLLKKAIEAESTIAQAWLEHQAPASATLQWPRNEDPVIAPREPLAEAEKRPGREFSHPRVSVPSGVVHHTATVSRKEMDFTGWKRAQGTWEKGDVRVGVTLSMNDPAFCVQARGLPGQGDGEHQVLFSNSNLAVVMSVAEATHALLSSNASLGSFWRGFSGWSQPKDRRETSLSWPVAIDVLGVLSMDQDRGAVMSREKVALTLQRNLAIDQYAVDSGASPSWEWAREGLSSYGSLPEFWRREVPLPREVVDAIRSELHSVMSCPEGEDEALAQAMPHLRPSHPEDNRPLVDPRPMYWEGFKERSSLESERLTAIQSAWGRLEEDQEEGQPPKKEALQKEWTRLMNGLLARVESDPGVVWVTQRWEQLAQDYVESLIRSPKARGPRV